MLISYFRDSPRIDLIIKSSRSDGTLILTKFLSLVPSSLYSSKSSPESSWKCKKLKNGSRKLLTVVRHRNLLALEAFWILFWICSALAMRWRSSRRRRQADNLSAKSSIGDCIAAFAMREKRNSSEADGSANFLRGRCCLSLELLAGENNSSRFSFYTINSINSLHNLSEAMSGTSGKSNVILDLQPPKMPR